MKTSRLTLFFTIFSLFYFHSFVMSQNPILAVGTFVPDVESHVATDGRMYIYGSWDLVQNSWCSTIQHVFSSADLIHWTDHGEVFHSSGNHDDVPWSNSLLYAPDAAYKDGMYYMYFCMSDNSEGVASSSFPFGPFTNAIQFKGLAGIDPAVFVDDDGQAYYYWGQFNSKGAKLKPNMTEIDTTTIVNNLLTVAEHHFHEASSMRKRNGIYYYVYASTVRRGRPTCLEYATSTSPLGPFKYQGVIIDNFGCDPSTWNNHGSIQEFNGKWYVFYHRSSQGTACMRRVCIEPITFNADGTIPEVPMTSQGAGLPFDATSIIETERACYLTGNAYIKAITPNNEVITGFKSNDAVAFKYIDFSSDVDSCKLSVFSEKPITIDITLDDSLTPIGTINIPGNGDGKKSQTFACKISKTTGTHAVWLRIKGDVYDLLKIDWFRFFKTSSCPTLNILPYLAVNEGTSMQISDTIITIGSKVKLDPQPENGGTWSWNGPNGYVASTRSVLLQNIQKTQIGNYWVTNLNECGEKNMQCFLIDLKGTSIPAKIEAEDYKTMSGIDMENTTDVGGGKDVGWIDSGDWLEYSIFVPVGGDYSISYRVASPSNGGKIAISQNGTLSATTDIPNTGNWQKWVTIFTTIHLTEGTHTIRLTATTGQWNINWWSLDLPTNVLDVKSVKVSTVIYPNPAGSMVTIKTCMKESSDIQIFDINGRFVYSISEAKSDIQIPVSKIGAAGIYFVKTNNEIQKLIIK